MNKCVIISTLKETATELEKVVESADTYLFETGKECLNLKLLRGYPAFYVRTEEGRQLYVSSSDERRIMELCTAYYAKKLKAVAEREKKQIDRCIDILKKDPDRSDVDAVFDCLPEAVRAKAQLSDLTSEGYAQKWQESNSIVKKRRTHKKDDYHTFKTLRGDYVASKSEVIIADRLYVKGIPYHYEIAMASDVVLDESRPVFDQYGRLLGYESMGNGPDNVDTLHPDFYVLNKRTRKAYFWEHLGKMDDAEYCRKNLNRFMRIIDAGYAIGEDVIVTHEDSRHPLKTEDIEKIIEKYLS